MHQPVSEASQLMSSFHPPVPGRSREGDESSVPIWIFKLFTGTQQKGKQRDGWIPGVFWLESAREIIAWKVQGELDVLVLLGDDKSVQVSSKK